VADTTSAAIPNEQATVIGRREDPEKYDRFDYRVVQNVHGFAHYWDRPCLSFVI
jgi:hypothetical protein